jgi:hypothetical protein
MLMPTEEVSLPLAAKCSMDKGHTVVFSKCDDDNAHQVSVARERAASRKMRRGARFLPLWLFDFRDFDLSSMID